MKTYDCKVRLAGSRDNEVRLKAVTAAEVMILRLIHGDDTVEDIKAVGERKVPHAVVRDELWSKYVGGNEAENLGDNMSARARSLNSLFGPKHTPLPTELPEIVASDEPVKRVEQPVVSGAAEDIAAAMA